MTLFGSFCNMPVVAARNDVVAPAKVITIKAIGGHSNKWEYLAIMKTPFVSWIKADTRVRPSIASGDQVCNPIHADFPAALIKSKIQIRVIAFNLILWEIQEFMGGTSMSKNCWRVYCLKESKTTYYVKCFSICFPLKVIYVGRITRGLLTYPY